jgi:cellulose biosynthesis protein BcsQ
MHRTLVWTGKGGTGKALADSTPIPTPEGWRDMAGLRVGDHVFADTGQPCTVTGVHPQRAGRDCYEVAFSDGATLIADSDHRWAVRADGQDTIRTTAQITAGLRTGTHYAVDAALALQYPAKPLDTDPYRLGVEIGARRCGCIGAEQLTASTAQRVELLRGILTGAGITPNGSDLRIEAATRRAAGEIAELLTSLGAITAVETRVVHAAVDARALLAGDAPNRPFRSIVAVTPVPSVAVRCISVNSPTRLYLAGTAMIPTHNTTTTANLGPELARLGYRVLLVGFDPQGDLESTYGIDDEDRDTIRIEQLLGGGLNPTQAARAIQLPGYPGTLRLLPCSSDLNGAIAGLARRRFTDLDVLLDAFTDTVDIALIDTQGALSALSHTAARAADSVIFSMEPGYYEYRALSRRLEELDDIERDEGWRVTPLGVLFVRCDSRSRHMREYREHFADPDAFGEPMPVFDRHIRQQASVRDHPRIGLPTALAAPDSNVAEDYRALAEELAHRLVQSGGQAS